MKTESVTYIRPESSEKSSNYLVSCFLIKRLEKAQIVVKKYIIVLIIITIVVVNELKKVVKQALQSYRMIFAHMRTENATIQ